MWNISLAFSIYTYYSRVVMSLAILIGGPNWEQVLFTLERIQFLAKNVGCNQEQLDIAFWHQHQQWKVERYSRCEFRFQEGMLCCYFTQPYTSFILKRQLNKVFFMCNQIWALKNLSSVKSLAIKMSTPYWCNFL